MDSRLVNRNVSVANGRTSIRLEPELWNALHEICRRERLSISDMIQSIERRRVATAAAGGRTSAVRVHIVNYFRTAADDARHTEVHPVNVLARLEAETMDAD